MTKARNHSARKKSIETSKLLDKGQKLNATKMREMVYCYSCGAPRVIYSNHAVSSHDGPTVRHTIVCKL